MKCVIKIQGLDCAACGAELEEEIEKIEGVKEVSVSFVSSNISVDVESEEVLAKVKDTANHFEEVKVVEDVAEKSGETVLKLKNLHCANCASVLQDEIAKIKGVESVVVDFITQSIVLKANSPETVKKVIKKANKFEKVKVINADEVVEERESKLPDILRLCVSAVLFLLGVVFYHILADNLGKVGTFVGIGCFAVSYIVVGYPVLISTAKNIAKGNIFDENFLMTVASIGAACLGEYTEAVAVMWLYQLGEFLQGIAVGASRKSISDLMALKCDVAWLVVDGKECEVKPESLKEGDVILLKAGEKVPVDVELLDGVATLDTKALTGESEPRDYKSGDEILSGCLNVGGTFYAKVLRGYENCAVKKILDLVENSASKKAKPEKFITKFAKIYTPIVCGLALGIAVLLPLIEMLITGNSYMHHFVVSVKTALNFLVISCPCALIISVPLSYFSGIGSCAKAGILVKGATYLDLVAKVDTVAFDKTGTITKGNFEVVNVEVYGEFDREKVLNTVCAVEKKSSHPLAKAFLEFENGLTSENVVEVAGKGLKGEVAGKTVFVGKASLLEENGITVKEISSVNTTVFVGVDGVHVATVEVGDTLKKDAKNTIESLYKLGVRRTVMLTGDGKARADAVAKEVGIGYVEAELLPEGKLEKATALKENGVLMYVGDGINDAPVMAVSDVAVSMGKLGSGAAVEASDLVLISDDISAVPTAVKIARKTKRIVKQNIYFAIIMKTVFLVLSFIALPIWLAVFADVGVMLLAVLNSMRIKILPKNNKGRN